MNKILTKQKKMGIVDLNKKYLLDELIKGDSIFCATGITQSNVLSGIMNKKNNITSETLVTHKSSNLKKIVKKTIILNK